MILKWLRALGCYEEDETDKGKMEYSKKELNSNLKKEIMDYEKNCEQLCLKLQAKYHQHFIDKGLSNFIVKVIRTIDYEEDDNLTEKDCFEEAYKSKIVINYEGALEFKIYETHDYQAEIFIWLIGRKAYFCGKTI